MSESPDNLSAAKAALRTAQWEQARALFAAALAEAEDPEAHDGLGIALWWLNQVGEAHRHRTSAYLIYRQRGEFARAALIATWLGREQVFLNGNSSAMRGWFSRAERLLAQVGPCAEQGWFSLLRSSMLDSPDGLASSAFYTLEVAREFQDTALEILALAFGGMAAVALGRISEGMAQLDEAMAASTGGEVESYMAVSEVFCVMLSACELAGDLERTEHWCRAAVDFAAKNNCPFLSAYCRTTYGGLLTATGRWGDAEAELSEAIRLFEEGHRGLKVHAQLKLANLRVHQGRLEEAERLLSGYEDQGGAVVPLARLHMARGDVEMAKAVLEQALGPGGDDMLHSAPLLLLLVEVYLALGDMQAASFTANRLSMLAEQAGSDLLLAQAEIARGNVQRHVGETGAVESFRAAIDRLRPYSQSLLASRARLEMARLLAGSDRAGAVTWARAALACFERLGAERDADEAALVLRQLGVPGRPGLRLQAQLTQREAEVLALLARGLTNREIAERLFISAKTAEHHVSQILSKLGVRTRAQAAAIGSSMEIEKPA